MRLMRWARSTPDKDPLESAKGTILGMPERVFPVF